MTVIFIFHTESIQEAPLVQIKAGDIFNKRTADCLLFNFDLLGTRRNFERAFLARFVPLVVKLPRAHDIYAKTVFDCSTRIQLTRTAGIVFPKDETRGIHQQGN